MSYLNKRNKLLLSKHYKLKFYVTCIKRNKEKKKLLVPQSHWLIEVGAWVHFELTLRKQCTTSETICTNSYCYRVVKTYLIHCNIDWLKSIISSTHYGLYQSQILYVYKKKRGSNWNYVDYLGWMLSRGGLTMEKCWPNRVPIAFSFFYYRTLAHAFVCVSCFVCKVSLQSQA